MRDWSVLLIGGSASVRKSTLAQRLGNHYRLPVIEVDDVRIALQQMVPRASSPDLFFFLDHPDYLDRFETAELTVRMDALAETLWPALEALIGKHLACGEPMIIEGDALRPRLVAASRHECSGVQAIFLGAEREHLLEHERRRQRGPALSTGMLAKQTDFSLAHSQALHSEADALGLTVVPAMPAATLFDRVITILG